MNPKLRTALMGLGVVALIAFAMLGFSEHRIAAQVEACADQLAVAVRARDAAALERLVDSGTVREQLADVGLVEVGFTRPLNETHARVGLFVRATETSTQAEVVTVLVTQSTLPECRFVRDLEGGAFNGQGP
jgi:hypothetical protein